MCRDEVIHNLSTESPQPIKISGFFYFAVRVVQDLQVVKIVNLVNLIKLAKLVKLNLLVFRLTCTSQNLSVVF